MTQVLGGRSRSGLGPRRLPRPTVAVGIRTVVDRRRVVRAAAAAGSATGGVLPVAGREGQREVSLATAGRAVGDPRAGRLDVVPVHAGRLREDLRQRVGIGARLRVHFDVRDVRRQAGRNTWTVGKSPRRRGAGVKSSHVDAALPRPAVLAGVAACPVLGVLVHQRIQAVDAGSARALRAGLRQRQRGGIRSVLELASFPHQVAHVDADGQAVQA